MDPTISLVCKIREYIEDKSRELDKIKKVGDLFLSNPHAFWYYKSPTSGAEMILGFPEDKGYHTEVLIAFTVVASSVKAEEHTPMILELDDMYDGGFRVVPREELPTYIGWAFVTKDFEKILRGT